MRIGLFFGSFNPIHQGHLIMAQFMLNQTDIEEIWFVVSPQNPLKSGSDLIDEKQRLEMVKMAIADQPKFIACDVEFDMPKPSYSYNTLLHLGKKHPEHEFILLMGSDNLAHFDKWKGHEEILLTYEIYVYNRETNTGGDFAKNQRVRVFKGPLLNISSTIIRGYMRMKKSIKYLVPPDVEAYLMNLEE